MSCNGQKLVKGTDYTIEYANNTNVGKATVTITGKGDYEGTVKRTFKIIPKNTAFNTVKAGRKAVTCTWKKQTAQTDGYQIQYAKNKAFTSGKKTVKVTGSRTVKKKITGLTSKKTCYIRIRTYKTVNGKTYYYKWSKAVKTTVL